MGTPDNLVDPLTRQRGDARAARDATGTDARHVRLAEDDRALRRYLEVVLSRAGYRVTAAADGLEALKLALSNDFDAVVTDAVMPRLGGRELCRLLRARPELASLPVVLLTGLGAETHAAGEVAPADARLTKPVDSEALLGCLARLLGRPA
jgi:CheY-like chemotaxis protein